MCEFYAIYETFKANDVAQENNKKARSIWIYRLVSFTIMHVNCPHFRPRIAIILLY